MNVWMSIPENRTNPGNASNQSTSLENVIKPWK
jgi:hypothetical protein